MTRGHLVVIGFICNSLAASSASLSLCNSLVLLRIICRSSGGGVLPSSPTFGRDGRQDQDKIVRRHSLDRLNASTYD